MARVISSFLLIGSFFLFCFDEDLRSHIFKVDSNIIKYMIIYEINILD